MFQKQILNLGSVFPLLLSYVGTLQFPVCSQTSMSAPSVETERSTSAGSTFSSWCKDCSSGCYNIKNEMHYVTEISSVSYSWSLKAHLMIHHLKTCIFILFQSSSAKQRFRVSHPATDSWHAAHANDTVEGVLSLHLGALGGNEAGLTFLLCFY